MKLQIAWRERLRRCASEVDASGIELAGILMRAGAAPDDLLELGHRADLAKPPISTVAARSSPLTKSSLPDSV
jgi:hypothetical protein